MTLQIAFIYHPNSHNMILKNAYEAIKEFHDPSMYNFKDHANPSMGVRQKFKNSVHEFYCLEPLRKVEDDWVICPDLAVVASDEIPEEMFDFLFSLLHGTGLAHSEIKDLLRSDRVTTIKQKPAYEYEEYHEKNTDTLYCQITRPDEETPFTVAIKNYSSQGKEPLFAHIYFSKAWGIIRNDEIFLKNLWEHLKIAGEYDHNTLMKKYTAKCFPTQGGLPDQEPLIYRRPITDIMSFEELFEYELSLSKE